MKHLLLSALVCAACGAAQAVGIQSYATQVDIDADGRAQAKVRLELAGARPGPVLIPLGSGLKPGAIVIAAAPLGTTVRSILIGERQHLELNLPEGVPAALAMSLNFPINGLIVAPKKSASGKSSLPESSRLLKHSFVNTQPEAIGHYEFEVLLPEGSRVHAVREELPKPKRTEVMPRVRLEGANDRQGAVLQLAGLAQGDRTSMTLEVVPDQRSLSWLLVGLALAIAYLFGFRHLVSNKPDSKPAA